MKHSFLDSSASRLAFKGVISVGMKQVSVVGTAIRYVFFEKHSCPVSEKTKRGGGEPYMFETGFKYF